MKLVLSLSLAPTDSATATTVIYDQSGNIIGAVNANNGNAVIDIGDDHVVYVGPHPAVAAASTTPAATVTSGGAAPIPANTIGAPAAPAVVDQTAAQIAELEAQIQALKQPPAAAPAQVAALAAAALPAGVSPGDALKVEGVNFLGQLGAELLTKL